MIKQWHYAWRHTWRQTARHILTHLEERGTVNQAGQEALKGGCFSGRSEV